LSKRQSHPRRATVPHRWPSLSQSRLRRPYGSSARTPRTCTMTRQVLRTQGAFEATRGW
jgi:hypothetical protein